MEEMNKNTYETAFELIAHAGTAKGYALEAIDEAAEGDFEAAEQSIAEGRGEMASSHDVQFAMITQEAQGRPVELNLILVHALDHLTMAIMTLDLAERIVELYKRVPTSQEGC